MRGEMIQPMKKLKYGNIAKSFENISAEYQLRGKEYRKDAK